MKKKFKIKLQLFAEPEKTKDTETTEVVEKTVPYERFNKVIEERNGYKTSLTEKDATIAAQNEKLKAFEGYVAPAELEKARTESQKAYEAEKTAITIQSKLETKLIAEGLDADFADYVMSKADTTGMKLKDGKVIGLDDVVNGLKEKYPKMFGVKQPKAVGAPPAAAGGEVPNGKLTADEVRKLSNDDRIAYKKTNPDWWKY